MARQLVEVIYPTGKRLFNVNDSDFPDFKKANPSATIVDPRVRREAVSPMEIAASEPASPTPTVSAQIAELTAAVATLTRAVGELVAREPVVATLEVTAPEDVEDMTKPQLLAYAGDKGIDLGDAKTKAEILAAIQVAEGSASA